MDSEEIKRLDTKVWQEAVGACECEACKSIRDSGSKCSKVVEDWKDLMSEGSEATPKPTEEVRLATSILKNKLCNLLKLDEVKVGPEARVVILRQLYQKAVIELHDKEDEHHEINACFGRLCQSFNGRWMK